MSESTQLKPFEFKVVEKVGKFATKAIDQNIVKKMKQFSSFDKFQRELLHYDITIIKESPCVIGAPTILQINFAKLIIDKLTQIQTIENFKSKSEAHRKKNTITSDDDLSISENLGNKIGRKYLKEYSTKENINVYVYEANILQLDVDCIVSASNESQKHKGGVAAVIEKAAGYKLTKESNDFVRKCGNLQVGRAFTTTAGNLSYDCVIHTVGPRWSAYSPHSLQDVHECQLHLYQAVYNSFLEAEKRGLKSIALPAISSDMYLGINITYSYLDINIAEAKSEKDKEESDKVDENKPLSVSRKPGGIGFSVNIMADLKAKQEKRRSQMSNRPPASNKTESQSSATEEKKSPFGFHSLKPVSKTVPSENNNLPVKPSDIKSSAADIPLKSRAGSGNSDTKTVAPPPKADVKVIKNDSAADKPSVTPRPAIFGVPEDICVQQYAKATYDYSRKTSDEAAALKEIHFVDRNSNIVKKIQDAFYLVFVKGEIPDCD